MRGSNHGDNANMINSDMNNSERRAQTLSSDMGEKQNMYNSKGMQQTPYTVGAGNNASNLSQPSMGS